MANMKVRVDRWMIALGLVADGTIDAEDAGICWDDGDMFAVVDLAAVERQAGQTSRLSPEAKRWKSAEYQHGRGMDDWMERPRMTPEALFAERCHAGSMPTGDDFIHLLEQFARIRECQWARTMLAALADPDDVEYDLSTYNPDRPDLWLEQSRAVAGQA